MKKSELKKMSKEELVEIVWVYEKQIRDILKIQRREVKILGRQIKSDNKLFRKLQDAYGY